MSKPYLTPPDIDSDEPRFHFHNVQLEVFHRGQLCGMESAFIDTGFSGFLMIPEEFIEKYYLVPIPVAYTKVFTTAGSYKTTVIKIDVQLGGVSFNEVDALVAPRGSLVQAMIGAKLLYYFTVGLREGQASLTPNWDALSRLEEAEVSGTKAQRSLRSLITRGTKAGDGRA